MTTSEPETPPRSDYPLRFKEPAVIWASLFGVGFIRAAPGTWGTLAAALIWWLLLAPLPGWLQLAVAFLYFFTGWWASAIITRRYAVEDAQQIVADEVAGVWIALSFAPVDLLWIVGVVVAFRVLDILKPGPIGWLDKNVKGGLGVMLDDVLAGAVVLAGVVALQLVIQVA